MTNLYEKLILFSFCAFGFWYIVGRSKITRSTRESIYAYEAGAVTATVFLRRGIVELIECPACFGTWTGVLVGYWQTRNPSLAIMLALYICTTNLILYRFTGLDVEK